MEGCCTPGHDAGGELARLAYTASFVDDAARHGVLDPATHATLRAELDARARRVRAAAATSSGVSTPAGATSAGLPTPTGSARVAPAALPAPPLPAPPRGPSAPSVAPAAPGRLARAWALLASDVAVHGLAYLGVLLLFVGTLGFVLFAFTGVNVVLRPLAEVAIPAVLLGSARYLRGRGAPFVSAGLELVGGAVALVVALAAFADGSPLPPDLAGVPLLAVWTAVCAGFAAGYGRLTVRRPGTALRYLVAPAAWTGVGVVGLAFRGGASAPQLALVAAAVAATALAASARPGTPLAAPTRLGAGIAMTVVYPLTWLFAAAQGSSTAAVVTAGIAGVTVVDVLAARRMPAPAAAAQAALVALTALVLLPGWGLGWCAAAAAAALVLVAERWQRRGLPAAGRPVAAAAAAAALVAALADPSAAWAGAGVLAVQAGLARRRDDRHPLHRWWLPAAAAALAAGTLGGGAAPEALAAAAGLAALAALAVPAPAGLRVWVALTAGGCALAHVLEAVALVSPWRPAVWAGVGLGAVTAATLRPFPAAGHVAAGGYLASGGALLAAAPGGPRAAALAAWCAAWLVGVVAGEHSRAPLADLLAGTLAAGRRGADPVAAALAAAALAAGLPALVLEAGRLLGVRGSGAAAAALAATGLCYAAGARALADRWPLGRVTADAAVAVGLLAVAVGVAAPWPATVAVAATIVTVALLGRLRRPAHVWLAWQLSGVLTVLLAERAGVGVERLYVPAATWAAGLLAGGLLADDLRAGRRRAGEFVRTPALRAPATLGAVWLPLCLGFVAGEPAAVAGWAAVGIALLALLVALQLRAGGLSALSWACAGVGLGLLAPWSPLERPWLGVGWAAVAAAASWVVQRRAGPGDAWLGWDLAPLAVAHASAALAVVAAAVAGGAAATWAGAGALSLAVAAWRRGWAWAAGGALLVVAGAAAAGAGWLAAALAATAAAATVASSRLRGTARALLQLTATGAAGGAWLALGGWVAADAHAAVSVTAVAGGALAAAVAAAARARLLAADWAGCWAGLGATGLTAAALAAPLPGRTVGLALAAGAALAAAAGGLAATPLAAGWLRDAAAVLALAAGVAASWALQPAPGAQVGACVAVASTATVGALALWRWRADSQWLRPTVLVAVAAGAGGVAAAAGALPDRGLLAAALLAAALQAAAAGTVSGRAGLLAAGPALVTPAWLLFAADALGGEPQWLVAPLGLALLAEVEIGRWAEGAADRRRTRPELLALEVAGMAVLVAPALVQTVVDSVAHGLLAVLCGAALMAWGAASRVRRRAWAGAGVATVALALMIGVPLARTAPQFRGVALWLALGGLGAALVAGATTIERGRVRASGALRRLDELMEGWE